MVQRVPSEWKRRHGLIGAVVVVLCGSSAQPASAAAADKAAGRSHYETATRLYDVEEYGDAVKEFKAAYLAKPDPALFFNIGQCYQHLGQPDQAAEFFQKYLDKAAPGDPNRPLAEAKMREIKGAKGSDAPVALPAAAQAPQPSPAPVLPQTPAPMTVKPAAAGPAAVEPAGLNLAAATPAKQDSAKAPFYGRWWFWTGVGAVVVAGTVTALLLARGGTAVPSAPGATLGTQAVFQ